MQLLNVKRPRRVHLTLALFLLVVPMYVGCDSRDHDNPLDPLNPDSGGQAPDFEAVAGDREVTLVWPDLSLTDLEQVQILRWTIGGDVDTLAALPGDASQWVDQSAVNATPYEYRARFVVRGDPAIHLSNTDTATPGSERPWVVDGSWGGLWRLSPDGRDRVWKSSFDGYLHSLAVDGSRGLVWAASWSRNEVAAVDSMGALVAILPVEFPQSVAVQEDDGSLWVAAEWGIGRYSAGGESLFVDTTVEDPKDVAIDQVRGTCWVAEGTGGVWIRYHDGTTGRLGGFDYPYSLSIDESSGEAWLVDAGRLAVYRLEPGGPSVVGVAWGFGQPVDVAATADGGCWVADWDRNTVIRLSAMFERILEVGGFQRPRAVAVAGTSGGCWVAAAQGGRVVKVSGAGEHLGWVQGFDFPRDIAVVGGP